ncbi:MAG TPA: exosortase/archaeosortase family protein, partial [Candidatus Angelobacter sp.]|nr:exosortase/archaeosortase family protein [Candidatus Angelobacter sp.]
AHPATQAPRGTEDPMTQSRTTPVFAMLLALSAVILVVLPFVSTFDDVLTTVGMRLGIAAPLQAIVPAEVRVTVAILGTFGIHAASAGNQLVVWNSSGAPQTLFISWNCVGWQSLILLGLSLLVGLRGPMGWTSRVEVILFGVLGTVLVNLVRIAMVCLLAATAGYLPAVLFHDYGGTLLLVGWLFSFWFIAFRWLLPNDASLSPLALSTS